MTRAGTTIELHLSDEQIEDILISSSAHHPHLQHCEACRARVAQLAGPIEDFSALTLAWSERRSSTLQPVVLAAAAWTRPLHWVAAAALVCAGLFFSTAHHPPESAAPGVRRTVAAVPHQQQAPQVQEATVTAHDSLQDEASAPAASARNQQLDRDNRMLENIDDEWDAAPPSPEDSYGLRAASTGDSVPHLAPL